MIPIGYRFPPSLVYSKAGLPQAFVAEKNAMPILMHDKFSHDLKYCVFLHIF